MTENQLKYLAHQETRRHNLATEGLGVDTLDETKRANVAREDENIRSNMAREDETHRSNVVRETETERSNRASESLTDVANQIKAVEANTKAATAVSDQARKWVDLLWPF